MIRHIEDLDLEDAQAKPTPAVRKGNRMLAGLALATALSEGAMGLPAEAPRRLQISPPGITRTVKLEEQQLFPAMQITTYRERSSEQEQRDRKRHRAHLSELILRDWLERH